MTVDKKILIIQPIGIVGLMLVGFVIYGMSNTSIDRFDFLFNNPVYVKTILGVGIAFIIIHLYLLIPLLLKRRNIVNNYFNDTPKSNKE